MDRRLLALGLVTLALYARTLTYPLVYEDLNDPEAFRRPWPTQTETPIADALRHPTRLLRDVSFAISGTSPIAAHAGNVGVHVVNGLLVYAVAVSVMPSTAAVFAAGVFWLHPVQVESVAYVSSRADLVATMFLLLTVLSRSRVWLSLLMAVCCVLSKETFAAVLLIPLIVGSWDRVNRLLWAVWILITAPIALTGLLAFGAAPSLERMALRLTELSWLLTRWVWPVGLTVDHDWALITPALVAVTLIGWSVVAAVAEVWQAPVWSLALGSIVVFMLPRVFIPTVEGLHEHHLYAPAVALSLGTGWHLKGWL